MTSKLIVNSVRHTGASADGITMAADGSVTFPGNATCSGTATGFGGGKALKYEQTSYSTEVSSSDSSQYVDSGLSDTIQPSAANSKILVIVSQFFNINVANPNVGVRIQLLEGSNVITASQTNDIYYFPGVSGNASKNYNHRYNLIMVNTPSYTVGDTLTYKTQMKVLSDGNTTNVKAQRSSSTSYMTLVELAA